MQAKTNTKRLTDLTDDEIDGEETKKDVWFSGIKFQWTKRGNARWADWRE